MAASCPSPSPSPSPSLCCHHAINELNPENEVTLDFQKHRRHERLRQELRFLPSRLLQRREELLVCTGNTVSIFSTSTGMQITELEGHTGLVTSIVVVPVAGSASKFMCYCWTSSLDGTICYWDFSAPELIKKVKVQFPIFSMVIPNISSTPIESTAKIYDAYAVISVKDTNKPASHPNALNGQIQIYNLAKSRRVGGLLAETRKPVILSVSNSGEFVGIQNKRKLHIWKVPTKTLKYDEIKKIKLHHTRNLSALAFHPTDRMVAGGDVTGRILIWRGFGKRTFSDGSRPIKVGKDYK